MDKEHILNEIRRTAEANGGDPLGMVRFFTETGIRQSDWIGKFWTKWSDAVREAGFEPNVKQAAYDGDWLLEQLAVLVRDLGRYPTNAELRMRHREDPAFPSHNTFTRFGLKAQVALELMKWCESTPGWDDVKEICAPIAASIKEDETPEKDAPSLTDDYGYVYLLKLGKKGRTYKLGHSFVPPVRKYNIGLKMPEKLYDVHEFETDDPDGIEKYWQRRWEKKCKRGEWYDLDKADVAAFRLRKKFM